MSRASNAFAAVGHGVKLPELHLKQQEHTMNITHELREYLKRRQCAFKYHLKILSFIIDGTYPLALALHHFVANRKSVLGHSLKEKVVQTLQNGIKNRQSPFTTTQEQGTGVDHLVESVHRFPKGRAKKDPRSKLILVQMHSGTA